MKNLASNPWFRRVGIAAFLFFLIKGMVWLGVAAVAAIALL